jgi:Secretion system C-terminal sorting domain
VKEFSEFWLSGSQGGGVALPVQMIYLEAEAMNNDSIQVRWATQTEINNRDFEVERSTDGNTWSTIGEVAGHDNSVVEEHYAFNDINVVPGVVYYYRLKQVDNNGNYQYTGIVQAKINAAGAFAVMNFVPNPTSGNTQLSVVATKNQAITVDFYDMLGQKVSSSNQQIVAGTNRIDFDLHLFASGTYSAVVTSENQLYIEKLVITK